MTLNTDYMLRPERENRFSCFTNSNLVSLGKGEVLKILHLKMGCRTHRKLRHVTYILGIPQNRLPPYLMFFKAFQETGV